MEQNLKSLISSDASGRKLLCLEVNPPKGTDVESIFSRLNNNLEGIDFFNVTDSALAKMKLAAFPFAAMLKSRFGIEAMVNLSCRDRNLIAIQGDLLAAWAMGVRSVVALTGDAVTIGDSPDRKGVFEVNSIGLLHAISTLNGGQDLAGHALKGSPAFVSGVVVNPNARNGAVEIKRLKKKREAGGVFALSQPVYDMAESPRFFEAAAEAGVDLFMGALPFKTFQGASGLSKVPGIKVPESLLERVKGLSEEDIPKFCFDHLLELADKCSPFVRGFHIISGNSPLLAINLAREFSRFITKS